MFLTSYENIRKFLVRSCHIDSLIHNGRGVWGSDFGSCSFIFRRSGLKGYLGKFKRLFQSQGSVASNEELVKRFLSYPDYFAKSDDFLKIPGSPIAYWVKESLISAFQKFPPLSDLADPRQGLATGNNDEFLRFWPEVDFKKSSLSSHACGQDKKWFPYNKGGDYRKWYGNIENFVNWENDGEKIKNYIDSNGKLRSRPQNTRFYFKESVSWTLLSSSYFGVRYVPEGCIFDINGMSCFPENEVFPVLGFMASKVCFQFLRFLNPTLAFQVGDIKRLPVKVLKDVEFSRNVEELIRLSKLDWDSFETSWDFSEFLLVKFSSGKGEVSSSLQCLRNNWDNAIEKTKSLEESNNKFITSEYGLDKELDPYVSAREITLTCNPYYRYGSNRSEEELETLLQCDTLKELVSYAIGCMMGRYSLDKPGLILASQGDTVRDYLAQISEPSFAPDDNAIIPLTDQEWFPDDATNRFRDFVCTVWGEEHLQENLDFVAESLCLHAIKPKKGEAALDTIRRYLSTQFYKDHLRTYKKRPIYWLFSSGKQKAFECLVYLHRYNESTLAEMRTDYVIPLTTKLASYVEKLEQDKDASTSAAEAKAIEKELSKLYKQQAELNTFDEKLRHYADQRISLDLDDGVKVNYGKFGDLLAEVKAVTGEKPQ